MPNTNYQTIHQMGSAVSDMVRQASGRDEVQNIDMDFVTVARNHCAVHEEYTGSAVSFEAHVETPMGLIVQIDPVQDLHGYENPWPEGGGKNKFKTTASAATSNGVTFTINSDGSVSCSGTATGTFSFALGSYTVGESDEILNGCPSGGGGSSYLLRFVSSTTYSDTGSGTTIPADASGNVVIYVVSGQDMTGKTFYPMVRHSSVADATFAPYSNICPITGWSGANVTVSPTQDAQDGTTYAITFPESAGTVYGGTLTVNKDGTGTLVVDRVKGHFDESKTWQKGESPTAAGFNRFWNLPSPAMKSGYSQSGLCDKLPISDFSSTKPAVILGYNNRTINVLSTSSDVAEFKTELTAMGGVDIVYPLETPVTYQLTNLDQIKTQIGNNNVWANTGDITVQFTDIVEDC